MDSILWLARILGPFCLIVGLWMFLRTHDVMRMWNSVKNNIGMLYMGGWLNLFIGLGVLSTYNSWSWGLPILITILGWLMVIRGILVFFATDWIVRFTTKMEPFSKWWAVLPLFFGVFISYLAFCC